MLHSMTSESPVRVPVWGENRRVIANGAEWARTSLPQRRLPVLQRFMTGDFHSAHDDEGALVR